ncbi:hypothetical protein [Microbacterium sp. UFMG61]|uniref:hypothetical protein n=1 Tax=Microbacterium sp. UFMG61 TaxID=2745935 RepID=UPI00188FBC77|nr:hypothetical protein [Microbacterium sp. UFMG61]
MNASAALVENIQWAFGRLAELPRNEWWGLEEGEPLYHPIPERLVRTIPGHTKSVMEVTTLWEVYAPDGRLVSDSRAAMKNQIRCYDVLAHENAIGKMRNGNLAINRGKYVVTAIDGDDVHFTRKDIWLEEFPSSDRCAELKPAWATRVDLQLAPRFARFETYDPEGFFYTRQVELSTGSYQERVSLNADCTVEQLRQKASALFAWADRIEAETGNVDS